MLQNCIFIDFSDTKPDEIDCLLCQRRVGPRKYPAIIQWALERKYCSSLNNYYYLRSISRIFKQDQ